MAAASTSSRRHGLRMPLGAAVFCLLMTLSIMLPISAFASEATPVCNPTATNGCVNGILQDSGRRPISGVKVTLSGKESAITTTDATGKWAFKVAADGSYTVAIDASIAKKYGLKTSSETVNIVKSDFAKQRGVVRFDNPQANGTGSPSVGTSASGGTSSSSGVGAGANSSPSSDFGARVWQQLYSGIIFGLMLCLMSVGMNLVYGTTGLSSFLHGEQVSLGGLMAYVGTQMFHMPVWASAVFAVLVGALTGLIQNELVWAPLRRKRIGTTQQLIVTIGLSMVRGAVGYEIAGSLGRAERTAIAHASRTRH